MLTALKLSCWSRPGIPNVLLYILQARWLYLSQQKCMISVPVGMSVGIWFLYRRAIAPKVSSLWKDQRRTAYIASTTTSVFRFCYGRLWTALTPVSSLRTLTGLAFCSCRSHSSIFIAKWRRGLLAFVISDEILHVVFTTTSNTMCHSLKGCNFITFPRTSRQMFRLRPTCILVFRYSVGQRFWSFAIESDSACKPSSSHWWGYPSHHCPHNAQLTCWSDLWFLQWKCSSTWLPSL